MTADGQSIPEDIMKAAEEALDNVLCNCVESCGGAAGLRKASIEEIAKAILAERERIVARLKEEADLTPCSEDAMVTRSNARLIEADFSYEEAERLAEKEEA